MEMFALGIVTASLRHSAMCAIAVIFDNAHVCTCACKGRGVALGTKLAHVGLKCLANRSCFQVRAHKVHAGAMCGNVEGSSMG